MPLISPLTWTPTIPQFASSGYSFGSAVNPRTESTYVKAVVDMIAGEHSLVLQMHRFLQLTCM